MGRVAKPYEERAADLERAGKLREARDAYLEAYAYYAIGRYPTPHTAGKMACFRKSLESYEKAGRYFTPVLERIEVQFGYGKIPLYVRRSRREFFPAATWDKRQTFPTIVNWLKNELS